jgi:GTP-binding protein HflX
LLIHLVDASNPRHIQQLESVERILGELELGQIPRLVVFNKSDLVNADELEAMMRQAAQGGTRECLAVSAINPQTLRPMLERAGEILARDLVKRHHEHEQAEIHAEEEFVAYH